MSKKKDTYSDAMNEWAAKQSFIRNRRNRLIHPNPELPVPIQALGYLLRLAIVAFVVTLVFSFFAKRHFHSDGYKEKLIGEVQTTLRAKEIDVKGTRWKGKQGFMKRVTATGSESAVYRSLDATQIDFTLPTLKRIRSDWNIDLLDIQKMVVDFKSGAPKDASTASTQQGSPKLIAAGLFPSPDLTNLVIKRISCGETDLSWGITQRTRGRIVGSEMNVYGATGSWRMDLEGGTLDQNWLQNLGIETATIRKESDRLVISDGIVKLENSTETGTIAGQLTLGRLPQADIKLVLPEASTRDLQPAGIQIPEFFHGVLDLSLHITGSTNTKGGIETSGKGTLRSGTFSKIPALEAVDKLLKTSRFRIFSCDEGEIEFTTGGGKLNVTRLECKSPGAGLMLRGSFIFTPGTTGNEIASKTSLDGPQSFSRSTIEGKLQLGVRPKLVEGNTLAANYFKETESSYVWMEIPLDGPIQTVTAKQKAEILAAIKRAGAE